METTVRESPRFDKTISLDDLARLRADELEALYAKGKLPASLRALDGALTGRMLAFRALDTGPIAGFLRRFAASKRFVWAGKSFRAESDRAGTGINRVQVKGVLGRQNLFPFETRFGPSALDGKDAVILDYDLGDNPPYIRRIHDEVREVSSGVYLGPAMWKAKTKKLTVVWFALDTGKR